MATKKIIIAGSGGQGALRAGQLLAQASLGSGWEVEWFPSYGAEMRGGTANCHVTISDSNIDFPMIEDPDFCLIMNGMSYQRFTPYLKKGASLITNCSMIDDRLSNPDVREYAIPADSIAEEEGNPRGTNMVMLGALIALMDTITLDSINRVIEDNFSGAKERYVIPNQILVKRGYEYVKDSGNQMLGG